MNTLNPLTSATPSTTTVSGDALLNNSVTDFLSAVAAKSPAPGGGSVAALTGALAAALVQMTLQYTIGKQKFKSFEPQLTNAMQQVTKARWLFEQLVEEDKAAYEALSVLLKLSPAERLARPEYPVTILAAIRTPESVGTLALAVLEVARELPVKINPLLVSDLGIAAEMALATIHSARLNVLVNLPLLQDSTEADQHAHEVQQQALKAETIAREIREVVLHILQPTKP